MGGGFGRGLPSIPSSRWPWRTAYRATPSDAVIPPKRVVAGSMSLRSGKGAAGGAGHGSPGWDCGMAWDNRNRALIEHATTSSPALQGPSGEAAVTGSGLPGALASSRHLPRAAGAVRGWAERYMQVRPIGHGEAWGIERTPATDLHQQAARCKAHATERFEARLH